jgi:hypothetical protein
MGTWGYGLFADDGACDVRGMYWELILDQPGIGDRDATRQMLEQLGTGIDDRGADPVIWLALAASQSRLGRLDPAVARRALQVIDNGEDIARWHDEGPRAVARRRATLARVRSQLTGAQPPRRRIRLPRRTSLQPGDVLACRADPDTWLLLRIARIYRNEPVCVLLDFAGPQIPSPAQIALLPDFLWADRWSPQGRVAPFTMHVHKKIDYAQAGFAQIGNTGTKPGDDTLDPERTDDWLTGITESPIVFQLLQRRPPPARHSSPRRAADLRG